MLKDSLTVMQNEETKNTFYVIGTSAEGNFKFGIRTWLDAMNPFVSFIGFRLRIACEDKTLNALPTLQAKYPAVTFTGGGEFHGSLAGGTIVPYPITDADKILTRIAADKLGEHVLMELQQCFHDVKFDLSAEQFGQLFSETVTEAFSALPDLSAKPLVLQVNNNTIQIGGTKPLETAPVAKTETSDSTQQDESQDIQSLEKYKPTTFDA